MLGNLNISESRPDINVIKRQIFVKLIQLIDILKTKLKMYLFAQALIIGNINMKRSRSQ